jgi:hypothetical protein
MTGRDSAHGDEARTDPDEALAMLQADHHTIRCFVQHYEATADVCTVLERHTLLEDTVLYAAFAVATDAAGEMLIGDAFRAHQLCMVLMEDLYALAPDDARFARRW